MAEGYAMREYSILFCILAFALGLGGCSSMNGFPERSSNAEAQIKTLQKLYFLPDTDVLAIYEKTPDEDKAAFRNKVLYGRMLALDLQFSLFQEALYKEGVSTNLALDMMGVAVGGAGAAVTNASASRILSALSGGISGTHTAINKNLYFDRTMPALMALMIAEREKIRVTIYKGMQSSPEAYPLGRGLMDLERYYLAGSIPGAIASVTKTAGAKGEEAQKELAKFDEGTFKEDKATGILRSYWLPDGKNISSENEQRLKKWLDDNGFYSGPGAISMFLYADWAAEPRQKAAKDLGLLKEDK